jgi:hypothetical protein
MRCLPRTDTTLFGKTSLDLLQSIPNAVFFSASSQLKFGLKQSWNIKESYVSYSKGTLV